MLSHELRRLMHCREIDELVVATTLGAVDDPVVDLARREGVGWFRGDERDVLSRYLGAARASRADLVVRITADCPLIDAVVTDLVVAAARGGHCDYASNVVRRSYPRGLDAEAFPFDVLERVARLATSVPAREHVTYFVNRERPELFILQDVMDPDDNADLRWTVDTEQDLALVRAIYELAALEDRYLPYPDLVRLVRGHPELVALNAGVVQKNV